MNSKKISNLIKATSFLLIAVILFSIVTTIYERKTYTGSWNYMAKMNEFYDLPNDSIEYICVGSSHAYCTVNPLEVWNKSGIKGFTLATQQQPLQASYHYIKEAFKTQSPKIVFLEGLMVSSTSFSEGVLYDAIDPLRFSFNKLQMIHSLTENGDREPYYFNILKYHSRWKEFTAKNLDTVFNPPIDHYKGFVALNGSFNATNQIPDYEKTEAIDIPKQNLDILEDILQFVKKNGAELIIMIAPMDAESTAGYMKSLHSWGQSKNVPIIDYSLMLDQLGVDASKDYFDASHLDISGAAKISRHLSDFLETKNLKSDKNDKDWQNDYDKYYSIARF